MSIIMARPAAAPAPQPRPWDLSGWRWNYTPDDPSLAWGGAGERARLRRSPPYALGRDAATPPADDLGDLWAEVLGFSSLATVLRLGECARPLRRFAAAVSRGGEAFACHPCYPISEVASSVVGPEVARQCGHTRHGACGFVRRVERAHS
mmetsp:Transcript_27894/g.83718  ORF Transcript_27894/g.83718 Transcript_27894/m.83718 type:complete len:150 (+) Transcript_27894:415-864(+)